MSRINQFLVAVLIVVNVATMFVLFKFGGHKSRRQIQALKLESSENIKGLDEQIIHLKKALTSSQEMSKMLTDETEQRVMELVFVKDEVENLKKELSKKLKRKVTAVASRSSQLKPLVDQLYNAFGEMYMIQREAVREAEEAGIELSDADLNALTEDIGSSLAFQVYASADRAIVIEHLKGVWQISVVIGGQKSQPIVYNSKLSPVYNILGQAESVSTSDLNNDGIDDFLIDLEYPFQNGEFKDGTLLVISNGYDGAYLVSYEYRGANQDSFEKTANGCLVGIPVIGAGGYASSSTFLDIITYKIPVDKGSVMSFSPKEVIYNRTTYVKNGKDKEEKLPLPSLEEQKKHYPLFKVNIFKFTE